MSRRQKGSSVSTANSLHIQDYADEETYIRLIANWHEATDGRGLVSCSGATIITMQTKKLLLLESLEGGCVKSYLGKLQLKVSERRPFQCSF